MKISIRWALMTGFLALIWGTHLITTTSMYLTSQDVLRQHARDIMQNIADLAMEQSQRHLLNAHGAAVLTRRLLTANVVGSQSSQIEVLERYLYDQLSVNPHFAGIAVKVILSSGYTLNGLGESADCSSADGFIQKPNQVQQLAEILDEVLHKGGPPGDRTLDSP